MKAYYKQKVHFFVGIIFIELIHRGGGNNPAGPALAAVVFQIFFMGSCKRV